MGFTSDSCRRAREAVSLALDEELPALSRYELDRHLLDCEACRLFANQVEKISLALRASLLERPSASMMPQLPVRRRHLSGRLAAVAAALVAAVGLAALSGSNSERMARTPYSVSPPVLEQPAATRTTNSSTDNTYYGGGSWMIYETLPVNVY